MKRLKSILVCALPVLLGLAACLTPSYIDKGAKKTEASPFGAVTYQVHETYRAQSPACVAVLPFAVPPEKKASESKQIPVRPTIDQSETVRRAVYAHLAPQGKRDVELPRIDFVLSEMDEAARSDATVVGGALGCDAILTGEVTEYGSSFLGIYSRVAVGANLIMRRTSDKAVLWEGSHVAVSHGGAIPMSPIGIAMGVLEAAVNLREEQLFRVIDDLARRLVSTIPDDRIAVLEDPVETPLLGVAMRGPALDGETAEAFLIRASGMIEAERRASMLAALDKSQFGEAGKARVLEALNILYPKDAHVQARYAEYLMGEGNYTDALAAAERSLAAKDVQAPVHFLRGRALIKLGQATAADEAMVRAAALDETNADYLNGLGFVNSLAGNHDRALAAYRIAIERRPANGFAYYNTAVTLFERGDFTAASDAFYGAGLAYIKAGNYGQAGKALEDLRNLADAGLDVADEISILENALMDISKQEGKDAS